MLQILHTHKHTQRAFAEHLPGQAHTQSGYRVCRVAEAGCWLLAECCWLLLAAWLAGGHSAAFVLRAALLCLPVCLSARFCLLRSSVCLSVCLCVRTDRASVRMSVRLCACACVCVCVCAAVSASATVSAVGSKVCACADGPEHAPWGRATVGLSHLVKSDRMRSKQHCSTIRPPSSPSGLATVAQIGGRAYRTARHANVQCTQQCACKPSCHREWSKHLETRIKQRTFPLFSHTRP